MEGTVLTAVLAVLTAVGEWFVTALSALLAIFYAEGQLTILGVLAVLGVGIGVICMVIGIIQNFFRLRS